MLYCFSGFLCGAVMLGVALRNEYLTLILGISGCLVFLLVVTSRRDELTNLRDDLQDRLTRGRQERQAAKLAWEAIQRIELCDRPDGRLRDRRPDGPLAGLRAGADLVRPRRRRRSPGLARRAQAGAAGPRRCRGRRRSFDSPVARDSGSR